MKGNVKKYMENLFLAADGRRQKLDSIFISAADLAPDIFHALQAE